jgi:hypothetical protein
MLVPITFPNWLRRSHPIVQRYLRQSTPPHFQILIFGLTVAMFLTLGSLSLPVMYFVFSLLILVQVATSSASKVYRERRAATWDLIRLAPMSSRELLLSLWAASLWQISRTWMMIAYRLLHGLMTVGVIIFNLVFAEIPADQALVILISGTIMIAAQPFADMYFSGMVGLAGANRLRDQGNAHSLVIGVVILYWLGYTSTILALLLMQQMLPTFMHLAGIFVLPVLLPLLLGTVAQRVAESAMR